MENDILDRSITYKVGKYRVVVDENPRHKDYTVFDSDSNLICMIDAKDAENVADALLEVIYDKEEYVR